MDEESIEFVKKYRGNLPTYYVKLDIQDFITYKYKNQMITDSRHCPSIELNLIWNEKIFMIQRALKINPFSSNYFCWVDAGINVYREIKPPSTYFPNLDKLNKLPEDKFIYCSSIELEQNSIIKILNKTLQNILNNNFYLLNLNFLFHILWVLILIQYLYESYSRKKEKVFDKKKSLKRVNII